MVDVEARDRMQQSITDLELRKTTLTAERYVWICTSGLLYVCVELCGFLVEF